MSDDVAGLETALTGKCLAFHTHCATLDAIAVQTPDGWTCITTAVIPADSASAHIGYDAHTGSKQ